MGCVTVWLWVFEFNLESFISRNQFELVLQVSNFKCLRASPIGPADKPNCFGLADQLLWVFLFLGVYLSKSSFVRYSIKEP